MKKVNSLFIINGRLKVYFIIIISIGLLAGCGQRPIQNKFIPAETEQRLLDIDTSEVGIAHIQLAGDPISPMKVWLNGILLATRDSGQILVPLIPGDYEFKAQAGNFSPNELSFTINQGDLKYFILDGAWVFSPHAETTKEEYEAIFTENGGWHQRRMVEPG